MELEFIAKPLRQLQTFVNWLWGWVKILIVCSLCIIPVNFIAKYALENNLPILKEIAWLLPFWSGMIYHSYLKKRGM